MNISVSLSYFLVKVRAKKGKKVKFQMTTLDQKGVFAAAQASLREFLYGGLSFT